MFYSSIVCAKVSLFSRTIGLSEQLNGHDPRERPGSFPVGKGWEFVTGRGAPVVNSLVFSYLTHQ